MQVARRPGREEGEGSKRHADPLRRIVQVVLVAYLSPVILAVLVVGGIAVAGSRLVAAAQQLARLK
jgi:hypothetical protein